MDKPLKTQILDYLQQQARMVSFTELVEHTQAEPFPRALMAQKTHPLRQSL